MGLGSEKSACSLGCCEGMERLSLMKEKWVAGRLFARRLMILICRTHGALTLSFVERRRLTRHPLLSHKYRCKTPRSIGGAIHSKLPFFAFLAFIASRTFRSWRIADSPRNALRVELESDTLMRRIEMAAYHNTLAISERFSQ